MDSDEYLSQLVDYIHPDPVKSELVENPEEWLYSSFDDYGNLDPQEIIHLNSFPGLELFMDLGGHERLRRSIV